jgi:UDP-glucuronate decarboxylase
MIDKIIRQDIEKLKALPKEKLSQKNMIRGGAGFIGSWLCDALNCFGANVTAVDNLSAGRTESIDYLAKDPLFNLCQI